MQKLINQLLEHISCGSVYDIRIGMHWTAVAVQVEGEIRCGLASTVHTRCDHHKDEPDIPLAGKLLSLPTNTLAGYALSQNTLLSSIGVAAINALLPLPASSDYRTINAEHIILEHGAGKNVAVIGRFPFIKRVQEAVKHLYLIELDPQPGEYSPEETPNILPQMDVIAITAMTLINKTFGDIIQHCPTTAVKMMLGPTTPLSPLLFDQGLDLLSGSIVENPQSVLMAVSQGANFRQIQNCGVRLVTLTGSRISGLGS